MNLINILESKGFIYQATDLPALKKMLETQKITFYIGFDCTANSLHVGNLTQLMLMREFQKYGHKAIILIGNATTEVGDPTGKNQIRKILTSRKIDENIEGIKHSISKILDISQVTFVRNKDWLKNLNYLDFLTSFGRNISINKMCALEIVKNRLNNNLPLSFLEFNYMILQGYDFCHLNKEYDCVLQCGGSDQWGNITFGIEMTSKMFDKTVYGLTTPLLVTSSGQKMGKTENGAVWLNEDLLSTYDYFQYWRNITDEDVIRFGKMFGDITEEEMLNITDINKRKEFVAYKITSICHGEKSARNALQSSQKVFSGNIDYFPKYSLSKEYLDKSLLDMISAILPSRQEARRYLEFGAVKVENNKIHDGSILINTLLNSDNKIALSLGKKMHYLVEFVD